jgi:hypothetical protein
MLEVTKSSLILSLPTIACSWPVCAKYEPKRVTSVPPDTLARVGFRSATIAVLLYANSRALSLKSAPFTLTATSTTSSWLDGGLKQRIDEEVSTSAGESGDPPKRHHVPLPRKPSPVIVTIVLLRIGPELGSIPLAIGVCTYKKLSELSETNRLPTLKVSAT